jgi:hypothetical protein
MILERQMIQMSLVNTSDGKPLDKTRLKADVLDTLLHPYLVLKIDIESPGRPLSFCSL